MGRAISPASKAVVINSVNTQTRTTLLSRGRDVAGSRRMSPSVIVKVVSVRSRRAIYKHVHQEEKLRRAERKPSQGKYSQVLLYLTTVETSVECEDHAFASLTGSHLTG